MCKLSFIWVGNWKLNLDNHILTELPTDVARWWFCWYDNISNFHTYNIVCMLWICLFVCFFSLGFLLHGHSHNGIPQTLCWPTDSCTIRFDEGHSHGAMNDNFNIRAAFLHVIGDIIQSIGVVVAAVLIFIDVSMKVSQQDAFCHRPYCTVTLNSN